MQHYAAVQKVREGLRSGNLRSEDLTARGVASFLGGTTSILYHHWGSLDGFLQEVSRASFGELHEALLALDDEGPSRRAFERFAAEYIALAFDHPPLYRLMFAERFLEGDGGGDRRTARGRIQRVFVRQLARAGSMRPKVDAELLTASLHGLVALAPRERDLEAARHGAMAAAARLIAAVVPVS